MKELFSYNSFNHSLGKNQKTTPRITQLKNISNLGGQNDAFKPIIKKCKKNISQKDLFIGGSGNDGDTTPRMC